MVSLQLVEIIFELSLLLGALLEVFVQLLVVLHHQLVLVTVATLHLHEGSLLLLLPGANESLHFSHACSRPVVDRVQAGEGRPGRHLTCLARVPLLADLLDVHQLLVSICIRSQDSLGQKHKLLRILYEPFIDLLWVSANLRQVYVLANHFRLLRLISFSQKCPLLGALDLAHVHISAHLR